MISPMKGKEYRFVPSYMKNGHRVVATCLGQVPSKSKTTMYLFRMNNSGCMITYTDRQLIGEVFEEANR